jgi:uncharacterized protein YndB with AHSA1/START domain
MTELSEFLDRRITIRARRETVFAYFTDSDRFARWWGKGSEIDPRPGGSIAIHYPDGSRARGRIVEIEPPRRIVFHYGLGGGDPTGESLVTITLEENPVGTVLALRHAFTSAKIRDHFVQGWRYQLALFSRAVSEEVHTGAADRVDAFLSAWGDPDAPTRRRLLESCAAPEIVLRDAYSATDGLEDLLAQLEAVQTFMPGVSLTRDGEVLLSHGTAFARWTAKKSSGETFGRGTNVYDLAPDGKIARVVGFWGG